MNQQEALQDPQIQQFIQEVGQQQKMQKAVHHINDQCFTLCVDKPGQRLDSRTETCLKNCVERFIDTSKFIVKRLGNYDTNKLGSGDSEFS